MDTNQKQELTSLRDAFRRNRLQLESSVIKNYMADFLRDRTLLNELNTDIVARAVWYCLCNNNADRDVLISKLYDYFTKKGMDNPRALEMISIALFLGGVDFQMNPIDRPVQVGQPSSSSSLLGNTRHGQTKHIPRPHSKKKKHTWIFGLAALVLVVLVVILIPMSGSENEGGGNNSKYSEVDLCRIYSGYIEMEEKQQSVMKVTFTQKEYHVTVSPSSNQLNKKEYIAKVRKNSFELDDGPVLTIEKTKNKMKLYCEAGDNYGKWYFESENRN